MIGLIIALTVIIPAKAQMDSTLKEFVPLHLSELLQYRDRDYALGTGQIAIADIIFQNGQHHFGSGKPPDYSIRYGISRIDSGLRVEYYGAAGSDSYGGLTLESSIYRLNEPVGVVWKICESITATICQPWFVRFDESSTVSIFEQSRQVMRVTPGAYCFDA